jgi:hypothetical protein
LGDWAVAAEFFEKALQNVPDDETIKNNLAAAQQKLKQQQESKVAADHMQQIVQEYSQTVIAAPAAGGLDFDNFNPKNSSSSAAQTSGLDFQSFHPTDPRVVDARNVPSGLPKSVDDAISSGYSSAPPGVSDRVRKGFQAIATHDWKAARACFQDARNHDPNNDGLKRLVALADYTEKRIEQGKADKPSTTASHRRSVQSPQDSDMEFLFSGQQPAQAKPSTTTAPVGQMEMPKESDLYLLFPGLPAIEAREMNDYMLDRAIQETANDPVLIKLSNRSAAKQPSNPHNPSEVH